MEAVALLILQLIIIATYFALQCTELMDELMGENDMRGWVGVTPNVVIACFIFLIPTMLYIVYVLVSITCRWKTTLRQARKDAAASANIATLKDDHFVVAVVKWFIYIVGLHSPYFYLYLFASEITEFIFQALALQVRRKWREGRLRLCTMTEFLSERGRGGWMGAKSYERVSLHHNEHHSRLSCISTPAQRVHPPTRRSLTLTRDTPRTRDTRSLAKRV